MQMLESREVPTVASLDNGTLTITGTSQDDSITLRQTASVITVSGVNGSFQKNQVSLIRISGGDGNDTIILDAADQHVTKPAVILGGAGNDIIHSGDGADYIDGESGNDDLRGSGGADKIAGDTGDDVIYGNGGNDSLAGGAGSDHLYGRSGVDHIWGGADWDYIEGGSGKDHIYDDFATWAVQVNDDNYVHHHILGVADNSGFGWFDANMPDADLRRLARNAARNNYIGRDEMINLFEQATDGTTITTNEFNTLSTLVHTDQVHINEQARYFGKKIIDGDRANQWYTGGERIQEALGNLHAGDSDDHLQKLIDKWFLGKDHPLAKSDDRHQTFDYQTVAGNLYANAAGPNAADIDQGGVGDCYFMAALGAIARKDPQRIRDMFTDNGDGTYTVRFFHGDQKEYVTVDKMLPVNEYGYFVFANDSSAKDFTDSSNVLWAALAEKAYAQINESGWIERDGTNSYNGFGGAINADDNYAGINGGTSDTAMRQIAGVHTDVGLIGPSSFDEMKGKFAAGKAVTFSTGLGTPPDSRIPPMHVFIMTGYDATKKTITLRNPVGLVDDTFPVVIKLNFDEVKANFFAWATADV